LQLATRKLNVSAMTDEWQDNTQENPFFKSRQPVEVEYTDGKTRVIGCPRCATGSFLLVKRWRVKPQTTQPNETTRQPNPH